MRTYQLKNPFLIGICMLCLGITLFSCQDKLAIGDGPYKNGPEALLHFEDKRPEPTEGKVGSEVTYLVSGLSDTAQFDFYINQTKAEVVKLTDSSVTVKVPEHASSGAASIIINNQSYFGPIFEVEGKVSIAPSFKAFNGANREIKQIVKTKQGDFLMVGDFTDYENNAASRPVNHIVGIDSRGNISNQLTGAGQGAGGLLNTLAIDSVNSYLYVGGTFGSYGVRSGISNLTRLNSNGSLDTMSVDLINLTPQETPDAGKDTVPTFNGGVFGGSFFPGVIKLFYDRPSEKVVALGNFAWYESVFYLRSTKGGLKIDLSSVSNLARFYPDGRLDSTFNFDPVTKKANGNANGIISDAVRTPDGNYVVVGNFTTFNNTTVNYIARIKGTDGSLDETFHTGDGADGSISRITYNKTTHKFLVTGTFHKFDGEDANGVAMLNEDGSLDTGFKFGETTQGRANYAGQLDNGLILVSGRFLKYEGVVRSGFMILNPDGTLAEGYNNTGAFLGYINQIVESSTSMEGPGVILVGNFSRFDNKSVGNIVKIAIEE